MTDTLHPYEVSAFSGTKVGIKLFGNLYIGCNLMNKCCNLVWKPLLM